MTSNQVKSNTLRADEQIQKNVISSLREYVDGEKQKRQPKGEESRTHLSQLSSGSESTLHDTEQMAAQKTLVRQVSANEGPSVEVNEGTERNEIISSAVNTALKNRPSEPTLSVKPDDLGGMPLPSAKSFSETGVGAQPSHSQGDVGPKPFSTTSPLPPLSSTSAPTDTAPSKGKTSTPTARTSVTHIQMNSEPSKASTSVVAAAMTDTAVLLESSQQTSEDSSSSSYAAAVTGNLPLSDPSTLNHPQTGTGLETSSSSSFSSQDQAVPQTPMSEKTTSEKPADRQAIANGKKKVVRGKQKGLKLQFQELMDSVVKCTLQSSAGFVDFRFSLNSKHDRPGNIAKKLVSCYSKV